METIEDIVREMRNMKRHTVGEIIPVNLRRLTDRIEAAGKSLIADRDNWRKQALDEDARANATCEKSSQVGNAAAMRKALEKFSAVDLSRLKFPLDGDSSAIYNSDKEEITIPYWRVAELLNEVKVAQDMAKSALAEPLRNCDVFEVHKIDDEFEKAMGFPLSKTADERDELMRDNWFLFKAWLFAEAKGEQK
jgi:hypothetical protein